MTKICQFIWNDKSYPPALHKSRLLFTDLILIPNSVVHQDRIHKLEYIVPRVSDCFEALIGALEVTGYIGEAESMMDRVLLADMSTVVDEIGKYNINVWDDYLNGIADRKIREFRAMIDSGTV